MMLRIYAVAALTLMAVGSVLAIIGFVRAVWSDCEDIESAAWIGFGMTFLYCGWRINP